MACSLRLTIALLTATVVLLVAVAVLSVTLTFSLAAVRDVGRNNALGIAVDTQTRVQTFFAVITGDMRAIAKVAEARRWVGGLFYNSNASMDAAQEVLTQYAIRNAEVVGSYWLVFDDGSSTFAATYPSHNLLTLEHSWGHPDGRLQSEQEHYNLTNLAPLPRDAFPNNPDNNLWLTGTLAGFIQATGGNRSGTLFSPVTTISGVGDVRTSLPLIAPVLFDSGASSTLARGWLAVSVPVSRLDAFVTGIRGTPNTEVMVYDSTSHVFAITNGLQTFETRPVGGASAITGPNCVAYLSVETCRLTVDDAQFSSYDAVASDRDFVLRSTEPTVRVVKGASGNLFVAVAPVPVAYPGLGLFVMVGMPESDIVGDIVRGRNIAIGISAAVFVVSVVISTVLISVLLAPLGGIARRMEAATSLNDQDASRDVSGMAEIAGLQTAYYAMNDELQRIKSFVPHSLLYGNAADDEDEDEEKIEADVENEVDLDNESSVNSNSNRAAEKGSMNGSVSLRRRIADLNAAKPRRPTNYATSRRSSHRTAHSDSSSTATPLTTATSLTNQHVTVLCLNCVGFHAAVAYTTPESIEVTLQDAVGAVLQHVTDMRGVVDSFQGDHFVATFNAVRPCAGHTRRAVVAGLRAIAALRGLGFTATAGVASGKALTGNVGTTQMKRYNVVGAAFTHAALLERLAKYYVAKDPTVDGKPVGRLLLPALHVNDISAAAHVQPVDIVRFAGTASPVVLLEATAERVHDENEEWLYTFAEEELEWRLKIYHALSAGEAGTAKALLTTPPEVAGADGKRSAVPPARLSELVEGAIEGVPRTNTLADFFTTTHGGGTAGEQLPVAPVHPSLQ